jgi:hypothetical protein
MACPHCDLPKVEEVSLANGGGSVLVYMGDGVYAVFTPVCRDPEGMGMVLYKLEFARELKR